MVKLGEDAVKKHDKLVLVGLVKNYVIYSVGNSPKQLQRIWHETKKNEHIFSLNIFQSVQVKCFFSRLLHYSTVLIGSYDSNYSTVTGQNYLLIFIVKI